MLFASLAFLGWAFASTNRTEEVSEALPTNIELLDSASQDPIDHLDEQLHTTESVIEEIIQASSDTESPAFPDIPVPEEITRDDNLLALTQVSDEIEERKESEEEVPIQSPLSESVEDPAFVELELPTGDIYEGKVHVKHTSGSRKFSSGPVDIRILMAHAVDRHPLDPHLEELPEDSAALILEQQDSSKSAYQRHMRRGVKDTADTGCFSRRRVKIVKSRRDTTTPDPLPEELGDVQLTTPTEETNDKPLLYMNMIASLNLAADELKEIQRLTRGGFCRRKMNFAEASDRILYSVIPSINRALTLYNDARRDGVLTREIDKFGSMATVFETRDKLRIWATANAVLKDEWPQLCRESDLVFTHTINMLQILVQFNK